MDLNETLEAIYKWVSDINNVVMRVEAKADKSLTLLTGENGHGVIARVDKVAQRMDNIEEWAQEYMQNREASCPVARDIAALRAAMEKRDAALAELAQAKRDGRTKLLIAGIGAAGVLLGGTGKAVVDYILQVMGG